MVWREARRRAFLIHTGEQQIGVHQRFSIAHNDLFSLQTGALDRDNAGMNVEHIIEPRRQAIVEGTAPDNKQNTMRLADGAMVDAGGAQHLGARALDEFQIVGVVNDSCRIGILIEHT